MLLPVVEQIAPNVISSRAGAAEEGRRRIGQRRAATHARPGSVPTATTWASVITAVDDQDRRDQRERDGAARDLGLTGGHGHDLVAAEPEDQQQRGGRELGEGRRAEVASASGRM